MTMYACCPMRVCHAATLLLAFASMAASAPESAVCQDSGRARQERSGLEEPGGRHGEVLLSTSMELRTFGSGQAQELRGSASSGRSQRPTSPTVLEVRSLADSFAFSDREDARAVSVHELPMSSKLTNLTWAGLAAALLGVVVVLSKSGDSVEEDSRSLRAKYVAEFVGTFMLVFSVGCNVLAGSATWAVLSIACTLMVSIYALGAVSGANFNPAVSLALGISKKMAWKEVAMYICVQLSAGILASLGYGMLLGKVFDLSAQATGPAWWQVGLAEMLYTFMLCFVVLNVAASKQHAGNNQFYGLAIGFVIVAGGYGAGHLSGGCFNPAVALGIDASSFSSSFGWSLVYFVYEFIGAALASVLFGLCRPDEADDYVQEDEDNAYPLRPRLISEFLGTYMLVLTVGLNVIGGSKAAVFSIAASLMCMIFALGSVSGAHFNPAVTTAILCSGRELISVKDAVAFVGVQLLGGIFGALTYMTMEGGKSVPLKPASGIVQAWIAEFIFTFLLSFVVLSVATVKTPLSEYFGLAIGACVIAGGLAIGSISGGSLNPAVSTGLAFSDRINGGPMMHCFSYSCIEILGGAMAAGIFVVTHPAEYAGKAT